MFSKHIDNGRLFVLLEYLIPLNHKIVLFPQLKVKQQEESRPHGIFFCSKKKTVTYLNVHTSLEIRTHNDNK